MSFSTSSLHITGSDGKPIVTYTGGSFAFKPIKPGDFQIRPFKVFKNWFFTSSDATIDTGSGIQVMKGIKSDDVFISESAIQNSNGTYQQTVWDGINFLFYETSSEMKMRSVDVSFGSVLFSNRKIHNRITIISIPQRYYGERIKPGSVSMSDSGHTFVDDGFGNLYDVANSASFALTSSKFTVGNAFYEHGLLVITSTGSFSGSFNRQDFMTSSYELKFKATHTIYEYETTCVIGEDEFNYTMNPTALSQSISRSLGQELLINSEFNDNTGWNTNGNWTIIDGFLQTTGNSTGQYITQSVVNNPTQKYVLNMEILDNTLTGDNFLILSGSSDSIHGLNNVALSSNIGFNSIEFTGSVNASSNKLRIGITPLTTGGTITLKSISLKQKFEFTVLMPQYMSSFSSSSLSPYVTTIGLYDDLNNLIAVGKLAKPIKNNPFLPLTFVVRWDM